MTFAIFDKAVRGPDLHVRTRISSVLRLTIAPAQFEQVDVWGESPAEQRRRRGRQLAGARLLGRVGSAGSGALLRVSDPAMRTRDLAAASARGRLADVTRRATHGVAIVLGDPTVQLGGAVGFDDTPDYASRRRLSDQTHQPCIFERRRLHHAA